MTTPIPAALSHAEHYDALRTRRLAWVSFLFGFSSAFPLYVASSYFEEAIGTSNVSGFYGAIFTVVLVLLSFVHTIVRKIGGSAFFLALLLVCAFAHVPLVMLPVSAIGTGFLIVYFAAATVAWVALDIVLEHFSEDRRSGRIRSAHLTAMNAGLLLAPLLSTSLLERFGFSGVFSVSLVLFSVLFFCSLFALYGINTLRNALPVSPIGILRNAFRRKDVLKIYAISFAMEFFYATMIVYTPIYLRSLGMEWSDIGIVFTVMLVPFVLIQYPLGVIADRRTGEKELLLVSILIAGLSTTTVSVVSGRTVFVWALILFVTRIGIAAIEILRDSYFYKRIDSGNDELIAFFRTASPVSNIAAALSTGAWFLFFPLWSVFLIPGGMLLLALVPAFFLEDNPSERERS